MLDIDPAALACLAALADEGSFGAAAQRLSVTQSAVSQRLRALESRLGQPLVVRARPPRLTGAGRVLLRLARQWQALQGDALQQLGLAARARGAAAPLSIAVNNDSLATWVLPALDRLVHDGLTLELRVDDQDHTHRWLGEGEVLGCVSTVAKALRGCSVAPLGVMRYRACASPGFVERRLGGRLHRGNFTQVPFLVFDRKDALQQRWAGRAFGVRQPRLVECFVPSSEGFLRAALLGWGIGMLPELQARDALARGALVALHPEATVDVRLYWHQWQLRSPGGTDALDRVGAALQEGARAALLSPAPRPAARRGTPPP